MCGVRGIPGISATIKTVAIPLQKRKINWSKQRIELLVHDNFKMISVDSTV